MSNSAKQRSFIRDLIKHLEEIGLEVILEQSKNFILSIIYRDRKAKIVCGADSGAGSGGCCDE